MHIPRWNVVPPEKSQTATGKYHIVAHFKVFGTTGVGCTESVIGPCKIAACPASAGMPVTELNAGPITVTGSGPDSPVALSYGQQTPGGPAGYPPATGASPFCSSGDTVTASGGGGPDLPAFAAQSIVAPSDIAVTSPACAAGACQDIPRSMDAIITWSGGTAGKVSVAYVTATDAGSKILACSFDASAGTGTVPSAALMQLDVGSSAGFFGSMLITPIDSKEIMVGSMPTVLGVEATPLGGTFTTTD